MHCNKPFFPAPTLFLNFFFCHCQHEIEETHFTGGGQRSYDEDGSSTKRWLAKWDSCNAISWICNVAPALSSWHHSSRANNQINVRKCVSSPKSILHCCCYLQHIGNRVHYRLPLCPTDRYTSWRLMQIEIHHQRQHHHRTCIACHRRCQRPRFLSLSLSLSSDLSPISTVQFVQSALAAAAATAHRWISIYRRARLRCGKKMRSTVQCCANYTERCALLTVRCAPLRHILSVMWKQKRQWQQTRWASDAAQRQMKPQKGAFSSRSTPYGRWCRRLPQCYSMQSISTDLWHLLHNHDRTGRISSHNSAFGIDRGRCNCRASTAGDSQSSSSSRPQWSPIRWPFDGGKHQHEQTTFEGQMVAVDRGQCVWPGPHWKRELCVCSSEGGPSHDLLRAVQQTNTLWWQTICEFDLHLCTHLNAQTHCT